MQHREPLKISGKASLSMYLHAFSFSTKIRVGDISRNNLTTKELYVPAKKDYPRNTTNYVSVDPHSIA
jgi:hypothetical protein